MRQQGLTLLELMITVAIIAIVATIAIPNFSKQIQETQIRGAMRDIHTAIQLTRNNAVTQNQRATLRHLGSWEAGWKAFSDPNNNGQLDSGEEELFTSGPIDGARITTNTPLQNYISFIGTGEARYVGSAGGAFQAGTMKICSGDLGSGYGLVLARSGRVRVSQLGTEECSD